MKNSLKGVKDLIEAAFQDSRFSRDERQTIKKAIKLLYYERGIELSRKLNAFVFELAREAIDKGEPSDKVLGFLEGIVKALYPLNKMKGQEKDKLLVSPGDQCLSGIINAIEEARKSIDVCVFAFTDNRISKPLLGAFHRGIRVRVITDNDKIEDKGADSYYLHDRGIEVRVDQSPYHMHHKFALFDQRILINGSFNWTRSASEYNQENLVVSKEAQLVQSFQKLFERLWDLCVPLPGG